VVDVSTGDVFALKHLRLGAEADLLKEVQQEGSAQLPSILGERGKGEGEHPSLMLSGKHSLDILDWTPK